MLDSETIFSTIASLYGGTRSIFFERFFDEERKYSCGTIRASFLCYPFFRNTMDRFEPFLPKESIFIHPEIKTQMASDPYWQRIIDTSVTEASVTLRNQEVFVIDVFEENDIDLPCWNEYVLRVRIAKGNFEDKMKLWETLEENIRSKIQEIRNRLKPSERKKIDAINERLSIRVDEIS